MNDITVRRPVEWVCASATDVGTVRTENEDAVLTRPEIGLWVVADGMGGHEAGSVASQMIVEALAEVNKPQRISQFVNEIENSIIDVNQRLLEYSEIMLDGRVIGSTFVGLLVYGQIGVCMWMGDSRLYVYRGGELKQLSRDHSHVNELLQSGAISKTEAETHPDANVITRAVGTSEEPFLDIDIFPVRLGDVYLLCSDGLYNAVPGDDISASFGNDETDDIVKDLMGKALTNGANDNVSIVAIKGKRKNLHDAGAD
ncbi:MAG: serine/threonine-protein phosphatase [Gammaproteobacteria bacterium]|nr:serine/threonine-protein phosphatase [Gammaproteobacteria bacterium]